MKRYANRRDNAERMIFITLRQLGVSVYDTDVPYDAIIGFRGVTYLLEIKDPKKEGWKSEFTQGQKDFAASWNGSQPIVMRTVQDAIDWVNGTATKTIIEDTREQVKREYGQ